MFISDRYGYMPVLSTPRLVLRKLTMHDAKDIYDYGRDPRVAQHVLWDAYTSLGEARDYIRYMTHKYRNGDAASWGIELRETGHIIGTIGFMWIQFDNYAAEVGYSLAREHWNKGLMTEALQCVIDYGFDVLSLNRIEAMHETDNPASGRVMQKCGMVKEGTLRQKLWNKGRFVDVDIYAIINSHTKG